MLFAIFLKSKTFFFSNWNPKIMVQFCYFLGPIFRHCTVVTVSCPLLQWMARMDMDWNLKKLGYCFRVVMLFLQKLRKKYYDWCYMLKFDLCFFNPMGAFLNYYVDFWLYTIHMHTYYIDVKKSIQQTTCKSWSC